MFRGLFYELSGNIGRCFKGQSLFLQLVAIPLTYVLVASGFDWSYYTATRDPQLIALMFPAALLGFFVPVFLPLFLLILGAIKKSFSVMNTGYALVQASVLGWVLSSIDKAFTGRVPPGIHEISQVDTSNVFQFGFMEGGIFWGWPSSHTAVAFAIAFTLILLYPKNKFVLALALAYALYIGFGVSFTIHWCSDFLAGALLGIAVGLAVGKSYFLRMRMDKAASQVAS